MKYSFLIASVILLTSCKKEDQSLPEDNGCIYRISTPVYAHSINNSDIPTVNLLFVVNSIDNSTFRYYQYIHDTFQTQYSPYTAYDEKLVRIDQYTNNLRIFNRPMSFIFWNDTTHYIIGHKTSGTNLDTLPNLTLSQLRGLFIRDIHAFDHSNSFDTSCMKAEFGYYDIGGSTPNEVLVKAWHLTPQLHSYPEAYYQDVSGQRIYYCNGILTIH